MFCALDAYIQKLSESPDALYLRPSIKIALLRPMICTHANIGVNALKKILPDLSKEAVVGVHYTNHSLRVTAITQMYKEEIPEI